MQNTSPGGSDPGQFFEKTTELLHSQLGTPMNLSQRRLMSAAAVHKENGENGILLHFEDQSLVLPAPETQLNRHRTEGQSAEVFAQQTEAVGPIYNLTVNPYSYCLQTGYQMQRSGIGRRKESHQR
ncbi:hypothetical protein BaRGS_00035066 [Batillaria attramentaria]|uniref:Uncharacterized protein n=1 Tax=Batillaria attramentaria TaxID=370345 RepID=A0ABD0JFY7_9CAEN